MRLFDLPQARHFCNRPTAAPGTAQSLQAFHAGISGRTRLSEGSAQFEIHRSNLIDSVERWLVYSLALHRRSFDMLSPISTPWAQVSLYYSSYFAANAILGMFGGWIGLTGSAHFAVDVERGDVENQELRIDRRFRSPRGAKGTHRKFWDAFYDATATTTAWLPTSMSSAISPVLGDFAWQIKRRNDLNYDMFHAWFASTSFHASFDSAKLRSITGPDRLQLETTEKMIAVALYFAKALALPGTALGGCGSTGTRAQMQKRLVLKRAPNLFGQSSVSHLLET